MLCRYLWGMYCRCTPVDGKSESLYRVAPPNEREKYVLQSIYWGRLPEWARKLCLAVNLPVLGPTIAAAALQYCDDSLLSFLLFTHPTYRYLLCLTCRFTIYGHNGVARYVCFFQIRQWVDASVTQLATLPVVENVALLSDGDKLSLIGRINRLIFCIGPDWDGNNAPKLF